MLKPELVYKTVNGEDILFSKPAHTEVSDDPTCHVCNVNISLHWIRTHIAKHLLNKEVLTYSCGFCGKAGCSV